MNNENNDVYHDDTSFNENGVDSLNNESSAQFPNANRGNAITGIGKGFVEGAKAGLNPNRNSPALGVNGAKKDDPMKGQKKTDKNGTAPSNKGNPANGQKDNSNNKNKNPLPGGMNKNKNDNNKNVNNPNNKSNPNNKNKENNKDKNKKNGFGSKGNPLARSGIGSKLGLGKKKDSNKEGVVGPNLNEVAQKGLKTAWTVAPIQVKVAVVALSIVPLIILGLIAFLSLFGGITAATTAAMCGEEGTSGSSYNGEDYNGSSDVKEFMCKMQNPLVNPSLYLNFDNFGEDRGDHIHAGIDLASYGYKNIPIYAAQAGIVTESGFNGSMGNYVKIKHGNSGIETIYMHMVTGSVKVEKDNKVGKGQFIGKMGTTGNSTGVHLHFEIRLNGNAQNPGPYFKKDFKKNCGSSWDGEPAGDSAKQANDTSGVTDISSDSSSSSSEECCVSGGSSGSSSSKNYCPNGITVEGVGTLDLEDYIAGVISKENYYINSNDKDNIEAMKAQAIAARTYAINYTDNCTKKISNSESAQTYQEPYEKARKAVEETSGVVMTYKEKVFSSEYDAFCINDQDCPDASCNGTTCSVTYTKVPSSEKHKITVKPPHSKYAYSGDLDAKGHARGMSQYVARQMQDEGKKYDEILKFFYADGVSIPGATGGTCSVGGDSFDGKIYKFYQTDYPQKFCGNQTISHSGCGPTSMAVVVSSLLKEKHDPVELSKFACDNNYCGKVEGQGCYASLFDAAAKKYGLNSSTISVSNKEEIMSKLNGGKTMFIALMTPTGTPFALTAPHFIVIYGTDGNGKVSVWDPYESHGVNDKTWDFDKYFNSSHVTVMYMFSKK